MRAGSVPCSAPGPRQIPAGPSHGTEVAFSQGAWDAVTHPPSPRGPGHVTHCLPAGSDPSSAQETHEPKWRGCWED